MTELRRRNALFMIQVSLLLYPASLVYGEEDTENAGKPYPYVLENADATEDDYSTGNTAAVEFPVLGTVVVTATRIPQDLSATADNISVLSSEDIAKIPALDAGEALSFTSGIVVQRGTGVGQPATVNIQGCLPRQVKVMVDGIPFNTQSEGLTNLSQFPLNIIERIEIIKGPASSAWGSASGGVINIITKKPGKGLAPRGSVTGIGAENGTFKHLYDVSGKAGPLGYFFASSFLRTEGFQRNSDVKGHDAFGKVTLDLGGDSRLTATFGAMGSDIGFGEFPEFGFRGEYEFRTRFLGLTMHLAPSDVLSLELAAKTSDQDSTTRTILTGESMPISKTNTGDIVRELSLVLSYDTTAYGIVGFGFDLGKDTLDIRTLFYDMVLSDINRDINRQAYWGRYSMGLWDLEISLGMRFDTNSAYGSQVSPSAGIVYQLPWPQKTFLRATGARAFNAPPLSLRFVSTPFFNANRDLEAEHVWMYELGIESEPVRWLHCTSTFFQAFEDNGIVSALDASGMPTVINAGEVRRQGVEIEVILSLCECLSLIGGFSYSDVENRDTGETVPDRPRQTWDIGLDFSKNGWTLSTRGRWINQNGLAITTPAGRRISVEDQRFMVDLKLSRRFDLGNERSLTAYLAVYNLFDQKTYFTAPLPLPRRHFESGITLAF